MTRYDACLMYRARARTRLFATGSMLGCALLVCLPAFALDPSLHVNQYAHTVVGKIRDGFSKGVIQSIAQTPDGYLWLGSEFGLLRFDGVRAVAWQPPRGQQLPSDDISSLLGARDGTLWIGTAKGLVSLKDRKLTAYPELTEQRVSALIQAREGSVWIATMDLAGRAGRTGKVCAIHDRDLQCSGEGIRDGGAFSLHEDSTGTIWVGVSNGLWQWKPGPPKFYALPAINGIQALAADDDGALLIGTDNGIRRLKDGKIKAAYPSVGRARQDRAIQLLRDRDGGLWIGTRRGLFHVHHGLPDVFAKADGFSSDYVLKLFEDREGSIWATTLTGLDRFREWAVSQVSVKQGLSNNAVVSVLGGLDGSVWLATLGGLNHWINGKITAPLAATHPDGKIDGFSPFSLFQTDRGRIWVSSPVSAGYLENGRLISVHRFPASVTSFAEDRAGNLWIDHSNFGLFRILGGSVVQEISWSELGFTGPSTATAADVQAGLWIGFLQGGVAHIVDGRVHESYAAGDGLGDGRVYDIRLQEDRTVWAATEGGLSRIKDGRVATLTSKNGLPCDSVHLTIEDDIGSVWLSAACGLVRISKTELASWALSLNHEDKDKGAKHTLQLTLFDASDGVHNEAVPGGNKPQAARSSDGKLWFRGFDGVNVVDPAHVPFNKFAPPVQIEQVTADRTLYDPDSLAHGERLPALLRDLEIDYTALSLVAPENVRFKYKLEGMDADWQDAGTRRQAFYNNLAPGNYRFRVIAGNNSGVWNEAGASLHFSVAPAYYQTTWFRVAVVAALLVFMAALYQLRLRQMTRQFNLRTEERVAERMRIARELHDTLLQSFQAALLRLHTVGYLLPDRPDEAQKTLENVVEQARQAITDGRNAVHGLRSSTLITNELLEAISALCRELAAEQDGRQPPDFHVQVAGTKQSLAPLIRDEVQRIASEALRNAFRHSQAKRIEVELRYDRRQLRLLIRDNGRGIDAKVLSAGGREGHYGLAGMHERAKLCGGTLSVRSELASGTECDLTIPAGIAYAKASSAGGAS